MAQLQLTFAMLKPHVIKNPIALETIRKLILSTDFKIVKSQRHKVTQEEAEIFYRDHRDTFFYNRLITFITSGPSDLYILARFDAIRKWRQIIGPTKVFKTQFEAPNTIRAQFGLSDTRNATHGSDSPESARKEIGVFFPHFNLEKWYVQEELLFRTNKLEFIEQNFVHIVNCDIK